MARLFFLATALALSLSCPSSVSIAGGNKLDDIAYAASNLQQDAIACAAFHSISEVAFSKPGWELAVHHSKEQQKAHLQLAVSLMGLMDQDPKALAARSRMTQDSLKKEMTYNFSNYSILLQKYAEPCKELMSDSAGRFVDWLMQARAR